jgi:Flp pilus assembly protein TadD
LNEKAAMGMCKKLHGRATPCTSGTMGLAGTAMEYRYGAMRDGEASNMRESIDAFRRGVDYLGNGDAEEAIVHLSRAIQLDPTDQRAYNYRGVAYRISGRLGFAIADHTEAIRLAPDDPYAYGLRAYAWVQLGIKERARADFAKADQFQAALGQEHG